MTLVLQFALVQSIGAANSSAAITVEITPFACLPVYIAGDPSQRA